MLLQFWCCKVIVFFLKLSPFLCIALHKKGKRDSENLKDFIDAAFQFHIVLYYCYKTVSDYGTIDLDANGIFRGVLGLLDTQVLFNPTEEDIIDPL